jgi:hypothetical protein
VAAREDQLEPLVGDGGGLERLDAGEGGGRDAVQRRLRAPPLRTQPVDRLVAGGRGDPGGGVARYAVARPALERDDEGVLDGLLGAVEVAERARQDSDRLPRLAPEQAVDGCAGCAQAPAFFAASGDTS